MSNTRLRSGVGELAEVGDVRVAACLHPQPGDGSRVEVHRHDRGRAPVERERRHGHASVADRQQLPHACLGLRFEHRDRIGPVLRRAPFGVRGAGNRAAERSSRTPSFVPRCFHGLGSSRTRRARTRRADRAVWSVQSARCSDGRCEPTRAPARARWHRRPGRLRARLGRQRCGDCGLLTDRRRHQRSGRRGRGDACRDDGRVHCVRHRCHRVRRGLAPSPRRTRLDRSHRDRSVHDRRRRDALGRMVGRWRPCRVRGPRVLHARAAAAPRGVAARACGPAHLRDGCPSLSPRPPASASPRARSGPLTDCGSGPD